MAKASALTGQLVVTPNITDWESFTPTGSWTTNTTYTGSKKRSTTDLLLEVLVTVTNTPTAASLTINIPDGGVVRALTAGTRVKVGDVYLQAGGSDRLIGVVRATGGDTALTVEYQLQSANTVLILDRVTPATQNAPFALTSGGTLLIKARVPIVGWSTHVSYGAGMSNLVTPGLVYQSDEIDITAQVTCAQAGFTMRKAFAVVSMDKNGKWWMDYVISSIFTSATVSTVTVAITGVVFRNETGFIQAQCATWGGSVLAPRSYANPNANTISVESSSTTATGVYIFGRALLNAKPSWA